MNLIEITQYERTAISMFQDSFVGHIVENDVTVHGLTVRMEQLMDQNKNFQVIYGAKVRFLIKVI